MTKRVITPAPVQEQEVFLTAPTPSGSPPMNEMQGTPDQKSELTQEVVIEPKLIDPVELSEQMA